MSEPLPGGPLMWGQAGEYDAIDDRLAVTALAAGRVGLVRPPALTPGAGLTVNIGYWHGIADCEDGTLAVAGSRDTQTIDVPAGGATPRTDVLFADVDPDAGTWSADLYTEAEAATRAGLRLGTITVPAGANSAAQMDLRPATVGLRAVLGSGAFASDAVNSATARSRVDVAPIPCQAGHRYWFRGQGGFSGNAANTRAYIVVGGLAVTTIRGTIRYASASATDAWANAQARQMYQTAMNNAGMQSPPLAAGGVYHWEEEGWFDCSADGFLVISVAASATGATQWTAAGGWTLLVADITTGLPGIYAAAAEPGEPGRIIR